MTKTIEKKLTYLKVYIDQTSRFLKKEFLNINVVLLPVNPIQNIWNISMKKFMIVKVSKLYIMLIKVYKTKFSPEIRKKKLKSSGFLLNDRFNLKNSLLLNLFR